jgi:hypothetical protein
MSRDSRVSKHFDTKHIADLTPSSEWKRTVIFVKWRPFGRSNNPRVMDWIQMYIHNVRDPLSLGEVEGVLHF